MAEERTLLNNRDHDVIIMARKSGSDLIPEKTPFLTPEPVKLTPAWEGCNLPNDQLNFKGVTMDRAKLEVEPPVDRGNLIYITMLIHGIGTLTAWNMFITAKGYFVDYKLSKEYTNVDFDYSAQFVAYLSVASQCPNLLFNWLNIFVKMGGNLTNRIVWSLSIEVLLFVMTVILAMVDTSAWPGVFFWLTMITVVLLNTFNGIFQNSVYGVAANLPQKYMGAVVLGSNIAGSIAAIASTISLILAPTPRTSAIYYFLTALFILLACIDTYFALPLNRFYRYHELMAKKANERSSHTGRPPYFRIFRQAFPQLLNIFMIFSVTLFVFPAVSSDIKVSDPNFFIPNKIYLSIMCFLTFNLGATLGSFTATHWKFPTRRLLFIFVWARIIFIPLILICNYCPKSITRTLPIYISNDWAYWFIGIVHAWSSGHLSSLAMMYVSKNVEPQYATQAGMFAAAMLITGIVSGIGLSYLGPTLVSLELWKDLFPTI